MPFAGHHKSREPNKVLLRFGLGCDEHSNCFSCHNPDCRWSNSSGSKKDLYVSGPVHFDLVRELRDEN